MSHTVTKTRAFDSRYDPYFRHSSIPRPPDNSYKSTLQHTSVAGSDRALFFAQPVVKQMEAPPPEIVLARAPPALVATPRDEEYEMVRVDIAIQTILRESEAQTDPWLPDTTEHTRPRAWFEEEELEKLSLEERQRRLVELEVEQWAKRDQAIVELQQRRFNLLVSNFQKREDQDADKRRVRVEEVLNEREVRRKKAIENVEKKRLKVLRTLTEQRRQMTAKKVTKRDIVNEYADHGSTSYAPMRRQGRADAKCYIHPAVFGKRDIETDESLEALDELERLYHQTTVIPLKTEKSIRRADRNHQEFLKTVQRTVDEKDGNVERRVQVLKIAQKIEKPQPRPKTPETKPGVENDEKEMAVILLQRLLRGRALQSEMYRSLENQRQLIRELRTVEALREAEDTSETTEEREAALSARANRETAATVEGKVIGEMLSFLNHQLKRRVEERRIDAMMKLAERERRRREAEEAGRREEELKLQSIEDDVFRRVMGVNYESAESYLESVINRSIENAAEELATATAKRDAEKITKYTTISSMNSGDDATVARDLVAAFLFPEVEKDSLRKRLRIEQQKYRRAADNAVRSIQSKI